MDVDLLRVVGQIAGIGGLSLGVLLLLLRNLLQKLKVPGLTRDQWFKVVIAFLHHPYLALSMGEDRK